MRIDISMKELAKLHTVAAAMLKSRHERSYRQGYGDAEKACGGRRGWVSHPVADPAEQPPSVTTVATTEGARGRGADNCIDKEKDVPYDGWLLEGPDRYDAYCRAEAVAASIIKSLLDFEAWFYGRLLIEEKATVERVRFHTDVAGDGRTILMRHLTEYRNAERCIVPREGGLVARWAVPPDDGALADFEANVVRDCVSWACGEYGIDVGEYLDRDGKAGGGETDETRDAPERHEVGGDITEEEMTGAAVAADEEVNYVWSIVNDRLSALERWVNSKVGNGGISVSVTYLCDIVRVRIVKLSDKECGPLIVKDTKVGKGRDNHSCVERILSDAYDVVFGTFEELSYSEFIESISVATDGR